MAEGEQSTTESRRRRPAAIPTIGRARELEQIRAVVEDASAGSTQVLFLSGEGGIGKSRLLAETAAIVESFGGRFAIGRCFDEVGMPPFLPWIELGSRLSAIEDDASRRTSIADLLLDHSDQALGIAPVRNPETQRLHLYGLICSYLVELTRERPLMIGFDDLQWSDAASNQLLRYVVSHVFDARLLIAGAYRPGAARTHPELSKTVTELERARALTHLPVRALNESAVALLIGELGGGSVSVDAATVQQLSGGNPFAVEEIIRSATQPDADPDLSRVNETDGIAQVIRRRFEARSDRCRSAIELAAVAGREIDVRELIGALEWAPDDVVTGLEEAVSASLITAASPGNPVARADYRFIHDRVREAVLATLPAARLRILHNKLASVLDKRMAVATPSDLARLAFHLEGARRHGEAAGVYQRLGHAAMNISAFDDAAAAFERVVTLGHSDTGDLWLAMGNARLHAGRSDAIDALDRAEQAFLATGDRRGAAQALGLTGVARARREEHDLALAALTGAEAHWEALAVDESPAELISTQTEICSILAMSLGRYDEALAAGRSALDGAIALTTRPDLEARARLALAGAEMRSGDLTGGRDLLEPALALATQSRQLDLAAEIAGTLANHAYWMGDLPSSERFALRRRELGMASKDPFALRHSLPWLANITMARGDWPAAEALIDQARSELGRIDSPEPRAFLAQLTGTIALQQGRVNDALAALEEAIAGFRKIGPGTLPWYLGVLARAYLAAGDERALERTVTETISVVDALPARALPRAPSIAQLGIIAVRQGDKQAMQRWRDELEPYQGQFHWVLMDRVRGMLSIGLGDADAALVQLKRASDVAARGQIRPELLRVEGELALLTGASDAHVEALLTEMRLLQLADAEYLHDRWRGRASRSPEVPAGLSAREVEVLVLVAGGKTNREIADLLSISEKTVTNHLTHIFTKANLDNRAAAAAFALRHGLIN